MIIVYAYVVADILHKGHLEYLRNAKALGDKLIVGVLTNQAVEEKKPPPVMDFDDRVDLVGALEFVDVVVSQSQYSPLENVKKIQPDILVESTSHADYPAQEYMEKIGRQVALPYYPEYSSTEIKRRIK